MAEEKRENKSEDSNRARSGGAEGGGVASAGVAGPKPRWFVPQVPT